MREWEAGPTAPEPGPADATTLAAGVAAQMRQSPAATAVIDGARQLSYAELDDVACRIAGRLAELGAGPGQAVAVCLPRSWQLIALMLGVLRTGATVVPIDGASPAARIGFMLADAGCGILVHAARRDGWALPPGCRALVVDALLEEGGVVSAPEIPPRRADEVSFLFYTSGTTGEPKGVEVTDAGILRLALTPGFIDIRPGDRFACLSNPAFDALSFEVWVPLLTGGACVVIPDSDLQDPPTLAARLVAERIDTLFVTGSLFSAIVDQHPRCFATMRQVLVGGEQLNAGAVQRWYRANPDRAGRIFNAYGPTECTTFALSHPVPPEFDGAAVPIGTVLPRTGAVLMAKGMHAALPGETAELYLSGDGVARGYRNRPQETAERFVRLPWLDGGRRRYFRTGDLVRRTPEGLIVYVGRADRQVKVRGFRIEPGEVEQKILQHPAVRQVHVCTRRDEAGGHELLAYLVPQSALDHDDFDRHLKATLPSYMRPHRLYLVGGMPLTRNGKLDEEQLVRQAGAPWRRSARGSRGSSTSPAGCSASRTWDRRMISSAAAVTRSRRCVSVSSCSGGGSATCRWRRFWPSPSPGWPSACPIRNPPRTRHCPRLRPAAARRRRRSNTAWPSCNSAICPPPPIRCRSSCIFMVRWTARRWPAPSSGWWSGTPACARHSSPDRKGWSRWWPGPSRRSVGCIRLAASVRSAGGPPPPLSSPSPSTWGRPRCSGLTGSHCRRTMVCCCCICTTSWSTAGR
jgi:amino acid adenylation domain-containing protein